MAALGTRGTLRLTSPHTRGPLVKRFQGFVAARARELHVDVPAAFADGEWGPASARLARQVGVLLGLSPDALNGGWTPHLRRLVAFPAKRSGAAKRRAKVEQAKLRRGVPFQLALAEACMGIREEPRDSNWGPASTVTVRGVAVEVGVSVWLRHWGLGPAPHCGAGAGYFAALAGAPITARTVYCPYIEADAKTGVGGFEKWVAPGMMRAGDIGLCDWQHDGVADHAVTVIRVDGDYVDTFECNTSPGDAGSQDNGGGCFRRRRHISVFRGGARPAFPKAA